MKISQTTIIQRNPTILFSQLGDEYLALDAEAGFCYSLNLVSGDIWNFIEQPTSLGDLCQQLQLVYTVDEATCYRDVSEILTKLVEAKLVVVDAPQIAA